jgi:hypothetical protein
MIGLVWIPRGTEPDDVASWRRVVERALGGARTGRVELQRCGDRWRVRIAIQFSFGTLRTARAVVPWLDRTEEVTLALQSAGMPVLA